MFGIPNLYELFDMKSFWTVCALAETQRGRIPFDLELRKLIFEDLRRIYWTLLKVENPHNSQYNLLSTAVKQACDYLLTMEVDTANQSRVSWLKDPYLVMLHLHTIARRAVSYVDFVRTYNHCDQYREAMNLQSGNDDFRSAWKKEWDQISFAFKTQINLNIPYRPRRISM